MEIIKGSINWLVRRGGESHGLVAGPIAVDIAVPTAQLPRISTADIPRATLTLPEPTSEIANLAEEANEILGYSVLRSTLVKPLAKALKDLDIEVLDAEKVVEYMHQVTSERSSQFYGYGWVFSPLDGKTKLSQYTQMQQLSPAPYSAPIPEFVLRKAIDIKKSVPAVAMFIVHPIALPDPFLYVSLGNEGYYVEVWDEPKFEGRVTR